MNVIDPSVHFAYMNENFTRYYRTTPAAIAEPDAFWQSVYEDPVFREKIKKRGLQDCARNDPRRMQWEDVPITRKGEKTHFISAKNIPIPDKKLMVSVGWPGIRAACDKY